MAALSSASDAKNPGDVDAREADVLAYRPSAGEGKLAAGSGRPAGWRGATDVAMPPVVLRMPDLNETDSEPSWEPVLRPIRYRLILGALGLTLLLMALCYWVLKADVSPRPDEAPPWDGGNKNWTPGPVKAERPTEGRISTHRPVPTWRVTPLPPVNGNPADAPAASADLQGGPRLDIPGRTAMEETHGLPPSSEDPGVAHLPNSIDSPEPQPEHVRRR